MSLTARLWERALNGGPSEADLDRAFVESLPSDHLAETAAQKLRFFQKARAKRFGVWDELMGNDEFHTFLSSRDLMLLSAPEYPDADTRARLNAFEMESAAVGAMLCREDEPVSRGMRGLHARHFKNEVFGVIFSAICEVERRRQFGLDDLKEVCVWAVVERLRARGWGEKYPLIETLPLELAYGCPSTANMDFYIRRIVSASKLRHLHRLGLEVARLSVEREEDGRRVAAFVRLANRAIERQGWCDFAPILAQLEK